jgi:hypothetical protein
MSVAMTKQEREAFLAGVHVGVISIPEPGRGPLTVPVWYVYDRSGEVRVVTARTSRKGQLLARAGRFSLCAQTETPPYKYVSVEGPIVAIDEADLDKGPPPDRPALPRRRDGGPLHRDDTIGAQPERARANASRALAHRRLR